MKQLFLNVNNGSMNIIEAPAPLCKNGYVVVETIYSLVSAGTERGLASFASGNLLSKVKERPDQVKKVLDKVSSDGLINTVEAAFGKLNEPMPMGYSAVGRVVEVGKGVTDIFVGNLVAIAGQAYHAEINCVNRNLLVPLPQDFPDTRQAAFCALGAIALQGIHQAELQPGESVAVIGLGLLGIIVTKILNAYGCEVIGFDIDENKKSIATEISAFINSNDNNAEEMVKNLTNGHGVDKVIITASTNLNQPIELASAICRDRGIISMLGVTKMDIDRRPFYEKELTFKLARSYGPGRYDINYENKGMDYPIGHVRWTQNRNLQEFIRLIIKKKVDISNLITHCFDIDEAGKAYEMITNNPNKEQYIGILISYPERAEKRATTCEFERTTEKKKTNKQVISVGIIGAGNFVRSTVIPNMKKKGKFDFIALATTGGINASQASGLGDFKYITTDVYKLMKDEEIDLIVVATQHNTHSKYTIEALNHNKHVYCEKPLALTIEELENVKVAYESSKGRLFVGFNRRHAPLIKEMKEKLQTDSYPTVYQYMVNAGKIPAEHWTQDEFVGGGRIIGEAVHFIDVIQYMSSSLVDKIDVQWLMSDDSQYKSKDNCLISMTMKNGSIANIIYTSMGNKKYPKETMTVIANGKIAKLNNYMSVDWYDSKEHKSIKLKQDKGFIQEYENIFKVITSDKKNKNNILDVWNNHHELISYIQVQNRGGSLDG